MTEVWILGRWKTLPSGANWEVVGAFPTRDEAIDAGRSGEFVAELPMGRSPEEPTVFPNSEWIADAKRARAKESL